MKGFLTLGTNKHTVKLYWEQVRKHRPSFFTMMLCIPLGALLIDTLLPYFFSQAIGGLASHNEAVIKSSLLFAAVCV